MNDSSRVAKVHSVDELKHEEFDLVGSNGRIIDFQIFFKIVISELEDQVKLLFVWAVNDVHKTKL